MSRARLRRRFMAAARYYARTRSLGSRLMPYSYARLSVRMRNMMMRRWKL